jgi:hypothetical protein
MRPATVVAAVFDALVSCWCCWQSKQVTDQARPSRTEVPIGDGRGRDGFAPLSSFIHLLLVEGRKELDSTARWY